MAKVNLNQIGTAPQLGTDRPEGRRIIIEGESFSDTLRHALNQLNHEQLQAEEVIRQMVSGQDIDLHQVLYSVQRADLSFQLALQVRNKFLQAYEEIMRMQV